MARRSKRSLQVSRQQQKIKDGLRDASTQYGNENGQDYDLRALAGLPPKQEHRSRKARQPPPVKRPLNLVLSSDDEQVADPVAQPGPTKRPRPKQGMTYDENQMPASNGNALLPDSRTNAAPRKTAPPQVLSQLQRKEPRAPTTSKLDAHPLQSTPTCAPTDGAQAPAPSNRRRRHPRLADLPIPRQTSLPETRLLALRSPRLHRAGVPPFRQAGRSLVGGAADTVVSRTLRASPNRKKRNCSKSRLPPGSTCQQAARRLGKSRQPTPCARWRSTFTFNFACAAMGRTGPGSKPPPRCTKRPGGPAASRRSMLRLSPPER
ncbi:hypothetical protein BCR44DRAFT_1272965 [Catenaria anguillulae PL171]|uniref:Uncharacterized protein n=1 Tax=Catenaria anguillulae PL171 TaxID=765915 RepID=A0A1Y2H9S0_9FUNG|nr:hypothetical protein BCR44DRAFT_1272965 [Catenaria anguillulae PL171]